MPTTGLRPADDHHAAPRIPSAVLAARAGLPVARVQHLVGLGLLDPTPAGHDAGDLDRIRLIEAFADAGVPAEALASAQASGTLSMDVYPELHHQPDPPSDRTFAELAASLGPSARHLAGLSTAFGVAERGAATHLTVTHERLLTELAAIADATDPDLLLRAVRLFGEATRRASEAAVTVYHEATERAGQASRLQPAGEAYERLVVPWAAFARLAPHLAQWLVGQHLSAAIDAYSVEQTERMLAESGLVPMRPEAPPAIAFVDLSGFTRLSQELGDDHAARMALRLGELSTGVADRHDGRLVKLLGDGALVWFRTASSAVAGCLELLDAIADAGLPTGHAGIDAGPVVSRDGDVFGRTVNSASRLSDLAGPDEVLLPLALAETLPELPRPLEVVGPVQLQGIGERLLARVRRSGALAGA